MLHVRFIYDFIMKLTLIPTLNLCRELHERHMKAVLAKTTLAGTSDSEDSTTSRLSWRQSISERTRSVGAAWDRVLYTIV
jgi:hypothetical protein